MKARFIYHPLHFRKPGGTSRGILHTKDSWFIILRKNGNIGIGECSIIKDLSVENFDELEIAIKDLCVKLNNGIRVDINTLNAFPSLKFAYEMALLDLSNKVPFKMFESPFYDGVKIPINGLVWMGESRFMLEQIKDKLKDGFNCIKIKIASIDFDDELELIKYIRSEYSKEDVEIRVDANGGFSVEEAMEKMKRLSDLDIHSIEQPIAKGNVEEMCLLCANGPLDIALDEELIGIVKRKDKEHLINEIKPKYLILKPSLIGGLASSEEWVALASEYDIDWWVTSALESNVGLNAIAQWVSTQNNSMPQGLGTGQLFTNNIDSPLNMERGKLFLDNTRQWNTELLKF